MECPSYRRLLANATASNSNHSFRNSYKFLAETLPFSPPCILQAHTPL